MLELDDKPKLREGSVTLRRNGITYTGHWTTTGDRLVVYLGLDEESALLDMFDKEPKTLARILLWELVKRQPTKHTT
jgi:hypothetical protein